jgi:hypothetical protein
MSPCAAGSFLMMSIPHFANGQVGSIVYKFVAGAFVLLEDIW